MWSSIENAALSVYDRETLKDDVPCSLDAVLHLLYRLIDASLDDHSHAEQLAILQKVPVLFDLLFEQGDYGFYNAFLAKTYLKIAVLSEDAAATEMLACAQRCAENFDGQTDTVHTSLLFRGHPITPSEWSKASQKTWTEPVADSIDRDDSLKRLWQKA